MLRDVHQTKPLGVVVFVCFLPFRFCSASVSREKASLLAELLRGLKTESAWQRQFTITGELANRRKHFRFVHRCFCLFLCIPPRVLGLLSHLKRARIPGSIEENPWGFGGQAAFCKGTQDEAKVRGMPWSLVDRQPATLRSHWLENRGRQGCWEGGPD